MSDSCPDAFLLTCSSDFAQHLSVHQVEGDAPSEQSCSLPGFVQTTESSLLGISFKHTIPVAVWMSPVRTPSCDRCDVDDDDDGGDGDGDGDDDVDVD